MFKRDTKLKLAENLGLPRIKVGQSYLSEGL